MDRERKREREGERVRDTYICNKAGNRLISR